VKRHKTFKGLAVLSIVISLLLMVISCSGSSEETPAGDTDQDEEKENVLPPGDYEWTDGDVDGEDVERTEDEYGRLGEGTYFDPYQHQSDSHYTTFIGQGMIANRDNLITGLACFTQKSGLRGDEDTVEDDSPTEIDTDPVEDGDTPPPVDGDFDGSPSNGPGQGPEVVVELDLEVGDKVTAILKGPGFDGMIYVVRRVSGAPDAAPCEFGVININGFSIDEETLFPFKPTLQGKYLMVFDTTNTEAQGLYEYEIRVEGDTPVDGDETEDDSSDGDATETDIDSDPDSDPEEEEEGTTDACKAEAVAFYTVPDSAVVTGNFNDLHWVNNDLNMISETGLATWKWETNDFTGNPLFMATPSVYHGITDENGILVYIDHTSRKITPTSVGTDISLPGVFGMLEVGLTYLNSTFYAVDSSSNQIFYFWWDDGNWRYDAYLYDQLGTLAGLTSAANKLFLLESLGSHSYVHRIDPDTGDIERSFLIENQQLSDLAYSNSLGSMWASKAEARSVVRLAPTEPCNWFLQ